MKSVYLVSNVLNGGKTYVEYLLPILNSLRDQYDCTVLQTDKAGISKYDAEKVLNYPVEEVELEFILAFRSKVIFSNDASIGRLLDVSNFSVYVAHGNVGMPTQDKYYYSAWMSFWDAIVSSSRSGFDLVKTGLGLYRRDRRASLIAPIEEVWRSDLRNTSAVSVLPVKVPAMFEQPQEQARTAGEYVVGLLPTQLGICPNGANLYENLEVVINAVKQQIPHASFILRPYMTDREHPVVMDICRQLSQCAWISIDETEKSSKEFYNQCDTVITDASTGGVSFMLSTCKLPIYYVPATGESNPIIQSWLKQMDGLLPIARNSDELKGMALGFTVLTSEQVYFIYKKFYESEYSGLYHPDEVFRDLVEKEHESVYCQFMIDSYGTINQRQVRHPESLAL